MIPQCISDIAASLSTGTDSEDQDELSKDLAFGISTMSLFYRLEGKDVDWPRFLARLTLAVVSRAPKTERTDRLILLLTRYLEGEPVDDALLAAFSDPELAAPSDLGLERADFLRLLDEVSQ